LRLTQKHWVNVDKVRENTNRAQIRRSPGLLSRRVTHTEIKFGRNQNEKRYWKVDCSRTRRWLKTHQPEP